MIISLSLSLLKDEVWPFACERDDERAEERVGPAEPAARKFAGVVAVEALVDEKRIVVSAREHGEAPRDLGVINRCKRAHDDRHRPYHVL